MFSLHICVLSFLLPDRVAPARGQDCHSKISLSETLVIAYYKQVLFKYCFT